MLALVLAAINLRPGITSFAPLIERIAEELSLSRGLISLTTALPVLLMGLLAPLAPRLAVRFGLERSIALCLGLIGVALLLRLFGHNAVLLIGTAGLVGAGIAVAGPLLSGFIKRYFLERMGQTAAWYSLSMAVGGTLGVVVTAPATEVMGQDWTRGLALWALPALAALLIWSRLPNQPEAASESRAGLPWKEPRAWLLSVYFALQAGLFYALATWLVARYHEVGYSLLQSNAFFSGFMLIGLPSAFAMAGAAAGQSASNHGSVRRVGDPLPGSNRSGTELATPGGLHAARRRAQRHLLPGADLADVRSQYSVGGQPADRDDALHRLLPGVPDAGTGRARA